MLKPIRMIKKSFRSYFSIAVAALQLWMWPQLSFAVSFGNGPISPQNWDKAIRPQAYQIGNGMMAGMGRVGKNGGLAFPILVNGEKISAQATLPPISKGQNAIRSIRESFAKKTGKFALSLVPETLVFFVALGAVSKTQLWMNFADNPVSWEQHLMAHDLTTAEGWVGVGALAAFMLAARGSESLMYRLLSNSKHSKYFLPLVPYSGMSVGLLASTLVHEIHNKDQLLACTASLEQRIMNEQQWAQCEKAYDNFMDLGYEKMQDLMPTLMGMIGSTIVGAFVEVNTIQKLLSIPKGSKVAIDGLKLGWIFQHGAEIAPLVTPGGIAQRFIKLSYRVFAQFYPQTIIQTAIEPTFTTWWKNFSDGSDLSELETDIMAQLDAKKRKGWKTATPGKFGDLHLSLSKFSQYALDWRKGNIHSQIMAHQNWLAYLMNFSQMFLASMEFYRHYINEYNNRYISRSTAMFDNPYPFNGVDPLEEKLEDGRQFVMPSELSQKRYYEKYQLNRLAAARAVSEKLLAENEKELKTLAPEAIEEFKKTLAMLPTEEEYKNQKIRRDDAIQGLLKINKALNIKLDLGAPFSKESSASYDEKIASLDKKIEEIKANGKLSEKDKSQQIDKIENEKYQAYLSFSENTGEYSDIRYFYSHLRSEIGNPKPVLVPGYGYLKAFEFENSAEGSLAGLRFPETERLTDKENNSRWSSLGDVTNSLGQALNVADKFNTGWRIKTNTINYPNATQYLAGQMALGPNAQLGESMVASDSSGFPVRFLPPRLVPNYPYKFLFSESKLETSNSRNTIFNTPVIVGSNNVRYNNLMDLLRNQSVLPNIIQHKEGFIGWWKEKVETQYAKAWAKFEDEYQKIMVGIYDQYKYYNRGDLSWQTLRRSGLSYNAALSNGLQLSYRQERRLYLLVLGEILKDHLSKLDPKLPLLTKGQAEPKAASAGRALKTGPVSNMKETLKNRCPYTAGVDQSKCLQSQKQNLSLATIKYIPLMDFLKSSETYSLAQIVESYMDREFPSYNDPMKSHHFKFQDEIELSYQHIEWLMDQMKVTEVQPEKASFLSNVGLQTFETTRRVIESKISNQQLRDMQNKAEEKIKSTGEQFKEIFKQDPETIKVIEACLRGLRSIANQTAEIGRMINAVSYERSDEQAKNNGETICDTNSMVASKTSIMGGRGARASHLQKKSCDPKKAASPQATKLFETAVQDRLKTSPADNTQAPSALELPLVPLINTMPTLPPNSQSTNRGSADKSVVDDPGSTDDEANDEARTTILEVVAPEESQADTETLAP